MFALFVFVALALGCVGACGDGRDRTSQRGDKACEPDRAILSHRRGETGAFE